MEKYIITNNKVYIAHKEDKSAYTTNCLEYATQWDNKIKCENALNTLPKSFKNLKFKVEPINTTPNELHEGQVEDVIDPITNINTEIDEIISSIEQGFKLLSDYSETVNSKFSNIDKEISDIEHAAEFFNLNASEGFMIYKMLQRARQERRKIKDDMTKLKIISNANLDSWMDGKISRNIKSRFNNRTYTPRVLKELFDR